MRDLAKSSLRLPLAMSLFATRQMSQLMLPPSGAGAASAARELERVGRTAQDQLGVWGHRVFSAGDAAQRGVINVMFLGASLRDFDTSAMMRQARENQSNPMMGAMLDYVLPSIAWASGFLVNADDREVALQEFRNKLEVIRLVSQVETRLGLEKGKPAPPLSELVRRAYELGTFPALWAVEGLGNHHAERGFELSAEPAGLLTDPWIGAIPDNALLMLHAGIGMTLAIHVLTGLTPDSGSPDVQAAVRRFRALCELSSRPGYTGAALESLGLAARTLFPRLVGPVDRALGEIDEELKGYFWHGAGRALYFDPNGLLPNFNAPWRTFDRIHQEAPHDIGWLNAVAGFAWAITLVNMPRPEVMATVLKHHGLDLSGTDAFSNGVSSAIMMRYDTSPDDPHITPFIEYVPADPAVARLWRDLVGDPSRRALAQAYGPLKSRARLQELFQYRRSAA